MFGRFKRSEHGGVSGKGADMPKLTIDGQDIEVEAGTSILQACQQLGIEIAHFCYHERLSVAANCRMCLVELERAPKPQPSCSLPVGEGMVVHTNSEKARKARQGVMEFLLINHPLDCPICDQGGECDLQDQAMGYGMDHNRFAENKRAVPDKELGPLVKTVMTRCIHCTRCVRFADEIAGVPELGATGRGEEMEIGTYIEQALSSELSGNLVDICPVGALTSKPYAFAARPWELQKTESIDVLDAVGSNIRVDARGGSVLRAMPRLHEDVNEEWLADKSRFAVDGLRRQRLDRPYVRDAPGKLKPATWPEAFAAIATKITATNPSRVGAILGDQADAETAFMLKSLLANVGSVNMDCRQDGAKLDTSTRAAYLFNPTIAGIEQADAVLLIGANPRVEAPLLAARLRKRWLRDGLKAGYILDKQTDLTFPADYLGAGGQTLLDIQAGIHSFKAVLDGAERPMIIVGMGALQRVDGFDILGAVRTIAESSGAIKDDWNGFGVLHTAAGRVGALDVGFLPGPGGLDTAGMLADGALDVLYLAGADEVPARQLAQPFVIYQGHHGDVGAAHADVILPGCAYTEKDATYVNLEGRVQQTRRAVFPPGEAKEDWRIVRALSEALGKTLPINSLAEARAAMVAAAPVLGEIDTIAPAAPWSTFGGSGPITLTAFESAVSNYYMTCAISRASATMAQCTDAYVLNANTSSEMQTGTHG